METKHTPGPWAYRDANNNTDAILVFNPRKGHVLAVLRNGNEANARLIAAAPELLEACQTFAEWLRREDAGFPAETRFNTPDGEAKWREWYGENLRVCALAQEQARAAIAKATGAEA